MTHEGVWHGYISSYLYGLFSSISAFFVLMACVRSTQVTRRVDEKLVTQRHTKIRSTITPAKYRKNFRFHTCFESKDLEFHDYVS